MLAAMEAVKGKKMNINQAANTVLSEHPPRCQRMCCQNIHQAAKHCAVLRKSLENRVKKRIVHGTNPGPASALNNEKEDALVKYVTYMARGGFSMTRKIVCAYMPWLLQIKRIMLQLSNWTRHALLDQFPRTPYKHHPNLSLCRADKLDHERAQNTNKQMILEYVELLEKSLIERNHHSQLV